jgi:acyl-CoA thioester hydrolase
MGDETCKMGESTQRVQLPGFPIVVKLPILWGDLDAYGHVNNLVYLRWFEAARAVYATRVGVEVLPSQTGVGAVLATISCKFLRQANYPGDIFSGVRVSRLSIGSVTLEYLIADSRTGVPVAEGASDVVLYDSATEKPVAVPDHIRAAVEQLEGKSFPV